MKLSISELSIKASVIKSTESEMHVPSYVADLHSTPNWMNQQLQGSVQLILNNYQMTKHVLELALSLI